MEAQVVSVKLSIGNVTVAFNNTPSSKANKRLRSLFAPFSRHNLTLHIPDTFFTCIYIYNNFTEVQVSRVIIVLLLQNSFVWCKDHANSC